MSHAPRKPDLPLRDQIEPRPTGRFSSARSGGLTLAFAAIITAALLTSGALLVRSFITGSDAFAIRNVSFDSVVNTTVDTLVGLIPGGFASEGGGPVVRATTHTPSPSPVSSPSPTPQPSIDPATVAGSPLSLQSLTTTWESKGMKTAVRAAEADLYKGFDVTPVIVTVTKADGSVELAAFLYDGPGTVKNDWDTPSGGRPSPKSGRSLPSHTSIWWNQNAVVVVLRDGGLGSDALEAFLDAKP